MAAAATFLLSFGEASKEKDVALNSFRLQLDGVRSELEKADCKVDPEACQVKRKSVEENLRLIKMIEESPEEVTLHMLFMQEIEEKIAEF